MIKLLATAISSLFFISVFAQTDSYLTDTVYNFNFEKVLPGKTHPYKWVHFNRAKGYKIETSTTERHGGERSLLIERVDSSGSDAFASAVNHIPAKYIAREIEFSAYLKFENVKDFVGILIRIDNANGEIVEFNTLAPQHINGTRDWMEYHIKAPLPVDAQVIYIAAILKGPGKLWIDDAQVLFDGKDISQAKLNPNYNPNPVKMPFYGSNQAVSGTVKLKTARLYYEIYGNGEPLLLLHGNSQSIYAFKNQIGDLSKKYRVIVVDTRGQGKSTDETTGPLSYDLFADDMKQLLDSLHIKKTNILGWSDGGNTGLIMTTKYPDYVNKLAIMGANLFPTNEALPDTVLNQVKVGITEWSAKTDAHSKMEVRLFTMLLNEPHLTFDEIKKIKAPILVMAGEHDLILEKHTRAIAAAIPNSKLVIFKGATHYAPVEIVKEFNETVLDFFDKK